jgi:hypothetical protein
MSCAVHWRCFGVPWYIGDNETVRRASLSGQPPSSGLKCLVAHFRRVGHFFLGQEVFDFTPILDEFQFRATVVDPLAARA